MGQVRSDFYVYEHWRPDLDICFYVGKGHGDRAQRVKRNRNRHHQHVVLKLMRMGMCVEVRLVKSGLTESEAFFLEIERIAFWRSVGIELTNLSSGGGGPVGYRHSPEAKKKIKQKRAQQKIVHSEETKRKIGKANSAALTGRKKPKFSAKMKGRKLTQSHKQKISQGLKGHRLSETTRSKISKALIGIKFSKTQIENLRISHLGNRPTLETREKMRLSQLARWERHRKKELVE